MYTNDYKYNMTHIADMPDDWSRATIYAILVLDTINAIMNIKQFSLIILIWVETQWPGSWFAMAVLDGRSLVLDNNKFIMNVLLDCIKLLSIHNVF